MASGKSGNQVTLGAKRREDKRMSLCGILLMSPRTYKCPGVEDPFLRNGPVPNQNNSNRCLLCFTRSYPSISKNY